LRSAALLDLVLQLGSGVPSAIADAGRFPDTNYSWRAIGSGDLIVQVLQIYAGRGD
jgi:hypothetical protein